MEGVAHTYTCMVTTGNSRSLHGETYKWNREVDEADCSDWWVIRVQMSPGRGWLSGWHLGEKPTELGTQSSYRLAQAIGPSVRWGCWVPVGRRSRSWVQDAREPSPSRQKAHTVLLTEQLRVQSHSQKMAWTAVELMAQACWDYPLTCWKSTSSRLCVPTLSTHNSRHKPWSGHTSLFGAFFLFFFWTDFKWV